MPDVSQSIPFAGGRFSEAVRRELYERIARLVFSDLSYTPDDAGLQIVYTLGRWLALWVNLDEPAARPEHQRIRLVRIGPSPASPEGIELYDV